MKNGTLPFNRRCSSTISSSSSTNNDNQTNNNHDKPQMQMDLLQDFCIICDKPVYLMERMLIERHCIIHRNCLRCHICKKCLNVTNYNKINDQFLCPTHFKDAIRAANNHCSPSLTLHTMPQSHQVNSASLPRSATRFDNSMNGHYHSSSSFSSNNETRSSSAILMMRPTISFDSNIDNKVPNGIVNSLIQRYNVNDDNASNEDWGAILHKDLTSTNQTEIPIAKFESVKQMKQRMMQKDFAKVKRNSVSNISNLVAMFETL